jgi:hypothetical protein
MKSGSLMSQWTIESKNIICRGLEHVATVYGSRARAVLVCRALEQAEP